MERENVPEESKDERWAQPGAFSYFFFSPSYMVEENKGSLASNSFDTDG